MISDVAVRKYDGKPFHSRATSTGNTRSHKVDRQSRDNWSRSGGRAKKVRRSSTVKTAVRENTKAEPYLLQDSQPVKITVKQAVCSKRRAENTRWAAA